MAEYHNVDFIAEEAAQEFFSAKMVFNESGIIFFPVDREHRTQKVAGISYEDDYQGNALAAMLAPGRIEVRFHKTFSDGRVAAILRAHLEDDRLSFMRDWRMTYQGRDVSTNA